MNRLYFVTPSLDVVEHAELSLQDAGIRADNIHLLSNNVSEASSRNLHPISSLQDSDLLHWLERGFLIGIFISSALIALALYTGIAETYTWAPIIMAAIVILGFSTWEAGLFGMQKRNYKFADYDKYLTEGKHVLFVDCDKQELNTVTDICNQQLAMPLVGKGDSTIHPISDPVIK